MDVLYLIILFIRLFFDGIVTVIMKSVNVKTIIDSTNILFTSEEVSILACAQRCKFRHKDAAIRFQGKTCTCFINDDFEEIENNHGTISGMFLDKKMKKIKKEKINGGLGNWKNSTSCTKLCGILEQRRDCDSPKPAHGGADCTGIRKRIVECNTYGCQVVNVALGKNTTQSSTYNNLSKHLPSKAVDGDATTNTNTESESNPLWEVDMGEVKVIKEIRLNQYIYGNEYNQGLIVETRRKGEDSWALCSDIGDQKEKFRSFKCTNEQSAIAQFLRISATKKCYLVFYQVEIFGY